MYAALVSNKATAKVQFGKRTTPKTNGKKVEKKVEDCNTSGRKRRIKKNSGRGDLVH